MTEKKYEGNLADILPLFSGYGSNKTEIDPVLLDSSISSITEAGIKGAFSVRPYIDNSMLYRFIEHFREHDCNKEKCGETCSYCDSYAQKAIRFEDVQKNIVNKNIAGALHILDNGHFSNS